MRYTRGAEHVRQWTEDHSQAELAERVSRRLGRKVHQPTVSAWALGKNQPSGVAMVALHEEIGTELGWWLEAMPLPPHLDSGRLPPDPDASGPVAPATGDETDAA